MSLMKLRLKHLDQGVVSPRSKSVTLLHLHSQLSTLEDNKPAFAGQVASSHVLETAQQVVFSVVSLATK